ncbi:ubiquitin carboxyl-terminal hydrolase 25-like isoform X1 [Cynara cardunculus var. scolymus]|uniref:ubiquitin carboxyl-terminal hydrolase 25-like isoform X1 n=1 Tax=Cynara cardunculus var. scolymus TaxID=59895 RepID=UPI000D6295D1|nr:ubiquitin carboxyl-terminal hydrolase 25-like isoform X1 [Cynara cardunculus var. scolymus]
MAGLQLQMTWQHNLLIRKRKNGPPVGFKNLHNTCYLNSVLQCLTYTPPLANFCLQLKHTAFCESAGQQEKNSGCAFCLLEKRIVRSLSIDLTLDTPGKIIGGLKIFAEHFRFGRQEDAHEFLRYVIDACHTKCLGLKKLQQQGQRLLTNGRGNSYGGSTVVKEIFGGALQSQVECLACGNESNKIDEIMDISIDVFNSSSLKDALQKFFQPEILDGNNKYKCDNCRKLVVARKQMSMLQAPNILVIQLKRFEGIFGGKIDKPIALEEVLMLSSFMCKSSQDPHPEYKLFATIVHSGLSPDSGHYYAYIKDAIGRWYCCNDSHVSLSTLQEVLSEKVYILFFSRTKQKPVIPNKTLATNGKRAYDCNGGDMPKIQKSGHIVKSTNLQQSVKVDSVAPPRVDKLLSSPKRKLGPSGNSCTRKFYATLNMKIVDNKENNVNNGDVKSSNFKKTGEKKMPLLEDKNGFSQNRPVSAVSREESRSSLVVKGNGETLKSNTDFVANGCKSNGARKELATGKMPGYQEMHNGSANSHPDYQESQSSLVVETQKRSTDFVANGCKSNGARNEIATGKGSDYQEMHNGSAISHPDKASYKRKLHEEQQSCSLFAEDFQSQAKDGKLKKFLQREASSFLRTCGWSDEVHSFMLAKKKCARVASSGASPGNELKRMLIADAKSTFISRIPESIKSELIKHLKVFSQDTTHVDP